MIHGFTQSLYFVYSLYNYISIEHFCCYCSFMSWCFSFAKSHERHYSFLNKYTNVLSDVKYFIIILECIDIAYNMAQQQSHVEKRFQRLWSLYNSRDFVMSIEPVKNVWFNNNLNEQHSTSKHSYLIYL